MTRPAWEKHVRVWARHHGATHAVIDGCGPRKRMRVASTITRVNAVHGDTIGFSAHGQVVGGSPTIVVRDRKGRVVAQIGELVRRELTGYRRGEPVFEDRPVIA